MKIVKNSLCCAMLTAAAFLSATPVHGEADELVIESFDATGALTFNELTDVTHYRVEWASTPQGPWKSFSTAAAALDLIRPTQGDSATVSVPMFFRVVASTVPTNMAFIPSGTFLMGDTFAEGSADELPIYNVDVARFYMDRYEVSGDLWNTIANWGNTNGYVLPLSAKGNLPAGGFSWVRCLQWCNARSEMDGLTPAYYHTPDHNLVYRQGDLILTNDQVNWQANGYRLPTEAEWEKAARAGASGQRFPWGNTISFDQAFYNCLWTNYPDGTPEYYPIDLGSANGFDIRYGFGGFASASAPVDEFGPSGGLYNMAGNASEWCWDIYSTNYYSISPDANPLGPADTLASPDAFSAGRVVRGGGENFPSANRFYALNVRCANRSWYTAFNQSSIPSNIGFRCVRRP